MSVQDGHTSITAVKWNEFDTILEIKENKNIEKIKCGDVYLVDRSIYLDCIFCNKLFDKLEIFLNHLSYHQTEIKNEDKNHESPPAKTEDIDEDPDENENDEEVDKVDEAILDNEVEEDIVLNENIITEVEIPKRKYREKGLARDEWKCKICEFICKRGNERIEHLKIKHPKLKRPVVCDQCGKGFTKNSRFLEHVRIRHKGEKTYKCEFCSHMFPTSTALTAHVNSHLGYKPFVCEICSKSYRSNNALKMHRQKHHLSTGEKSFECDLCSKKFYDDILLRAHKKRHENQPKYEYECSQCTKSFKTSQSLILHEQIHVGNLKYKCEICDKQFTNIRYKKKHDLVHQRIGTPFSCDQCDRAYAYSNGLAKHKKKHHGANSRPIKFICNKCNENFKNKEQFEEHCRLHILEDKKFECDSCEERFLTQYALNCHRKRIHNTK